MSCRVLQGDSQTEDHLLFHFSAASRVGIQGFAANVADVKELGVTKGTNVFPLNFDHSRWTVEEALPWIFFGDLDEITQQQVFLSAVKYIMNEDDGEAFKTRHPKEFTLAVSLHKFLMSHRLQGAIPSRKDFYTPIIWCRLAVQFWLQHGGRQELFISAMTNWFEIKNRSGIAFVFYEINRSGLSIKSKMFLERFLFEEIDIKSGDLDGFRLKNIKQKVVLPKSNPSTTPLISINNSIGNNVLAFVRDLIRDAAQDRSIRKLQQKIDPSTQRYRYTGSRQELYKDLCEYKQSTTRYKPSVVIKAISQVAKCRKYWPKQ